MKKEDKDLLLKDLCARLYYGVKLQKVNQPDTIFELYSIDLESLNIMFWKYRGDSLEIGDIGKLFRFEKLRYKPYLRPMSNMTEEEENEYNKLNCYESGTFPSTIEAFDYLLQHHFDYRGLIDKGLALEAPEDMYK